MHTASRCVVRGVAGEAAGPADSTVPGWWLGVDRARKEHHAAGLISADRVLRSLYRRCTLLQVYTGPMQDEAGNGFLNACIGEYNDRFRYLYHNVDFVGRDAASSRIAAVRKAAQRGMSSSIYEGEDLDVAVAKARFGSNPSM